MKESVEINQSLLALRKVVSALNAGEVIRLLSLACFMNVELTIQELPRLGFLIEIQNLQEF